MAKEVVVEKDEEEDDDIEEYEEEEEDGVEDKEDEEEKKQDHWVGLDCLENVRLAALKEFTQGNSGEVSGELHKIKKGEEEEEGKQRSQTHNTYAVSNRRQYPIPHHFYVT